MKLRLLFATIFLVAASMPVLAAQKGDRGGVSSTNFSISLALTPNMEINTVTDIRLSINDRTVDATLRKPFCVQGSTRGKYTLVAFGTMQGDPTFMLRNAAGDELPYQVSFDGDINADDFKLLTPGVHSGTYSMMTKTTSCTGQTAFRITFRAADLKNAGSGLYTGSLTLMVSAV